MSVLVILLLLRYPRGLYIYYILYAEAIVKGDSLPYFRIANWDIFRHYTKEVNPINIAAEDSPLFVWWFVFTLFWPLFLVGGGLLVLHKLVLKRIRKRLEAAVLLHPEKEVREHD